MQYSTLNKVDRAIQYASAYPDDTRINELQKLKNFIRSYLISEGSLGDYDANSEIKTYVIPQRDFEYSIKNLLKEVPFTYNETLARNVNLFSRFSASFNSGSPYDCSGALVGYSQSRHVIDDGSKWIIIIQTNYSYDY